MTIQRDIKHLVARARSPGSNLKDFDLVLPADKFDALAVELCGPPGVIDSLEVLTCNGRLKVIRRKP